MVRLSGTAVPHAVTYRDEIIIAYQKGANSQKIRFHHYKPTRQEASYTELHHYSTTKRQGYHKVRHSGQQEGGALGKEKPLETLDQGVFSASQRHATCGIRSRDYPSANNQRAGLFWGM